MDDGKKCVFKVFFKVWAWIILIVAYLGGSLTLLLGLIELLELMGAPVVICALMLLMGISAITTFIFSGCTGETLRDSATSSIAVTLIVLIFVAVIAAIIGAIHLASVYLSPTSIIVICVVIAIIITGLISLSECGFIKLGSQY